MWRYDHGTRHHQPSSGWKLHVSATVLNAPCILKRIAPFLIARGVPFKAPRSLTEVGKLNAGLDYGYSQIGKIITVYPRNNDEAVALASQLHRLTRDLPAPPVPFDLRFSDSSNVYYRFGAFEQLDLVRSGRKVPAIYTPDGNLVPDVREEAKPEWVSDPFEEHKPRSGTAKPKTVSSIRVLKALSQRGKGGAYVAIDLRSGRPRLCLLKEGRKNGELTWDGRDGAWRVRNEKRVLSRLSSCGVPVPEVHSAFALRGNYYLVMEFLEGETLHDLLLRRRRRLTVVQVLHLGMQLAEFISKMHRAGWAWRDCKPKNMIVTRVGRLVPIDFEGATPIHRPNPLRWATPGFTPPQTRIGKVGNGTHEDLYALGSILFLLLTGRVFDAAQPITMPKLRRGIPPEMRRLVDSLLANDPEQGPTAARAYAALTSIFLNLNRQAKPEVLKAA